MCYSGYGALPRYGFHIDAAPIDSPPSTRSLGLDVLRGATMVGLAVLVFTPWTGWRGHAPWWGWRPSDLFFPLFLTVAGAGLALQTKRGVPWGRVLRRFVSLIVLGLLVNALLGEGLDLAALRFTGVLQRIALAGLGGAAVVALARRRWLVVTAVAIGLCLVWGVLILSAAADCPGGRPTPSGCGTLHSVDKSLLGEAHVYAAGAAGHDPEGIASTLGATASLLAGTAALLLITERRAATVAWRAVALLAMSGGWLVMSAPFLLFAPFGKRMWTPAFVSLNAAAGLAVLAVLTLLFDRAAPKAVSKVRETIAWPFVAVGRNALLSWTSLFVIDHALDVTPSGTRSLEAALVDGLGSYGYTAVMLLGWVAVWCGMHAVRWHVRL